MTTTASTRLARLLGLVPYLIENPGADLERTAAVFGVTVAELVDDDVCLSSSAAEPPRRHIGGPKSGAVGLLGALAAGHGRPMNGCPLSSGMAGHWPT